MRLFSNRFYRVKRRFFQFLQGGEIRAAKKQRFLNSKIMQLIAKEPAKRGGFRRTKKWRAWGKAMPKSFCDSF